MLHPLKAFGNGLSLYHYLRPATARKPGIELISAAGIMAAIDSSDMATSDLPSPPFLSVPGLPNFRDAGGYEVASDSPAALSPEGKRRVKIVRRGILFRSSEVGFLL